MSFLLKFIVLSIIIIVIVECTTGGDQRRQQCLSLNNANTDECHQDWKQISVLVADLVNVGRSNVAAAIDDKGNDDEDKVETKSSVLTLLIRAASSVIGRGANALKSLIVSGLMLLTRTILKISEDGGQTATVHQSKFVLSGRPIDWILENPYIKSMKGHAIDGNLTNRLDQLASGMPCVQLLVCRLSPIVLDMQRRVREDGTQLKYGDNEAVWNVSNWRRVEETARLCAEKHRDCTAIKPFADRDL